MEFVILPFKAMSQIGQVSVPKQSPLGLLYVYVCVGGDFVGFGFGQRKQGAMSEAYEVCAGRCPILRRRLRFSGMPVSMTLRAQRLSCYYPPVITDSLGGR